LARLPDVSDQLPAARTARAVAAGFVDYRFDPPAGVEDDPAGTRHAARPHVFQSSPRSGSRERAPRQSPILPDADPFSIPSISLQERLAPVARFLMLFLLFTAVSTATLLISGRRQKTGQSQPPRPRSSVPATAASHQRLEPAPSSEEPPSDPLTAIGPLGEEPKPALAAHNPSPQPAGRQSLTELRLAAANGGSLPQVQTSEPAAGVVVAPADNSRHAEESSSPPAVAKLPGFILESPSRQAQHDNDQSILH
jgi:hypothetical protein